MSIRNYLRNAIREAVENYDIDEKIIEILDSHDMQTKIQQAVEEAFDSMNIEDTIQEVLEEYLEEIIDDEVNEAVMNMMSEKL